MATGQLFDVALPGALASERALTKHWKRLTSEVLPAMEREAVEEVDALVSREDCLGFGEAEAADGKPEESVAVRALEQERVTHQLEAARLGWSLLGLGRERCQRCQQDAHG